jgi:hypothetical protein
MWQAFRKVLQQYGDAMSSELSDTLSGHAYFRRMIRNRVEWSIQTLNVS